MSKQTDFTHGVAMSYKGVFGLLSSAAQGVKVYLLDNPDDYFVSNGDGTWTSNIGTQVVDSEILAYKFAELPEDFWVWETTDGVQH